MPFHYGAMHDISSIPVAQRLSQGMDHYSQELGRAVESCDLPSIMVSFSDLDTMYRSMIDAVAKNQYIRKSASPYRGAVGAEVSEILYDWYQKSLSHAVDGIRRCTGGPAR